MSSAPLQSPPPSLVGVPSAPPWAEYFHHTLSFDPATPDLTPFFRSAPPRWAVYLMTDGDDRPVQLLCVRNLRNSLKHRLSPEDPSLPPSKRVNYRALVRHIHYRRVDSDFEADLLYLAATRHAFPTHYQALLGFRPAWFLHVDPDAPFPRYTRTTDLSSPSGIHIGPLEDRSAATRLIEQIESAFDLCRYHNILLESPRGKACAYKEMGRCPAPCDGSIGLDQYRRMVELSAQVLIDPSDVIRSHQARMRLAAAELKFELAARIKSYIDELSAFASGPTRHARRLEDFQYVVLQPGPPLSAPSLLPHAIKIFLVTPGVITEEAALIAEPDHPGQLLRTLLEQAESRRASTTDSAGAERISLVTTHLFRPNDTTGIFIPLASLDERSLAKALRDLLKQTSAASKLPRPDTDSGDSSNSDEGITRESPSPT